MSHLVIGHVSPSTACIWVRGDKKRRTAKLRYRAAGGPWDSRTLALEERRGYVAIETLTNLDAGTAYECELGFPGSAPPPVKSGRFVTAPAGASDVAFLLGSCNWSRAPLDILDPAASWSGIESLAADLKPDFMIHCGDQVYSDVPTSPLPEFMDVRYFRELYQKAWKIPPTARVLASMPHYMVLDDHEIFDDYYNGKPYANATDTKVIRGAALAAYQEYQHSHNPQSFAPALYYSFSFGGVEFFALDVRTERYPKPHNQIIGAQQMADFKAWLKANARATKFALTSVPFVGEARNAADKWSGDNQRSQREELIDFLASNAEVEKLVFLTGDMHCSYHATMTIQRRNGPALGVHELMSSPINQFGNGLHAFVEKMHQTTPAGNTYEVELKASDFYGAHSNVMLIKAGTDGRVAWDVYRTKGVQSPPLPVLAGTPFQL
jgi:alkaline phosphatase D